MKKFLIGMTITFVIAAGLISYIFINATKDKNQAQANAIKVAKQVANLHTIDEVYLLNGKESSASIVGKTAENEQLVVFINYDENIYTVKSYQDGISKQAAIEIVKAEKAAAKIVSVKLGIEKNTPLWEVYYKTADSPLNYYYVNFFTGEWHKKIENL